MPLRSRVNRLNKAVTALPGVPSPLKGWLDGLSDEDVRQWLDAARRCLEAEEQGTEPPAEAVETIRRIKQSAPPEAAAWAEGNAELAWRRYGKLDARLWPNWALDAVSFGPSSVMTQFVVARHGEP